MSKTGIQLMDITTLKAVLSDLHGKILPSRFEKVHQPEANTIQIGFRSLKGFTWIEISWGADSSRIVEVPPPSYINDQSTLAKQLQHTLKQLKVVKISQKDFERIVCLDFSTRIGGTINKTIVFEMMGRYSNFLLLDEEKKVITLGKQVRGHQSRIRPISTGDIYELPPALQGKKPSLEESFTSWKESLSLISTWTLKKALQNKYQGVSPQFIMQLSGDEVDSAREFSNRLVNEIKIKDWQILFERWQSWLTCLDQKRFVICFEGSTNYRVWDWESVNSKDPNGIAIKLGIYYQDNLALRELNKVKVSIYEKIIKCKQHEEKCILEKKELIEQAYQSKTIKEEADHLLTTSFPSKETIETAQKLYKKAKKLKRSVPAIKERILTHKNRLQILEGSESFLEGIFLSSKDRAEEKLLQVREIKEELDEILSIKQNKKNKKKPFRKDYPGILELISPSGLKILIGRNHKQNTFISFRKVSKHDLWFHAQECPGSHVILKTSDGIVEEEDLQTAADLAAFFSRAKGNTKVPIVTVKANKLKKIPGSIQGLASHVGGTVVWGDPSKGKECFER